MQTPRVSIVMPAHNVQEFVAEAINSIIAQTFQAFELIIVDDGSTDATADILRAARTAWPLEANQLNILHRANSGAAAARNAGAAEARGDLLAFIDADDRWSPDTLAHLVATLEAHPKSDIACPQYKRIDSDGIEVNYLGEPVRATRRRSPEPRAFDAGETLVATPAESATGVLVRRQAFEAAGGFDAALSSNNDVDCWLRILWTRKSTLVQCPHAIVDYRIRSDQITSNVRRMQNGHTLFLLNHKPLLDHIGARARRRHFGLVRAYWSLLAARQGDVALAVRCWLGAVFLYPRLVLPGTLGSSAVFAIAKAVLPGTLWQRLSAARRRLKQGN